MSVSEPRTPWWQVKIEAQAAEVERLREAGDRLRSTLDINLGCGHVDARAASHDDCPYCRAKRSALDAWDGALRALNAR